MNSYPFLPPGQNLILTGYIGPGQPAIAQQVAERLKRRFINVEREIEARAEMDIEALRARYGESRLKTVESEVLRDVLLYRGAVIRISGQTLMHGDYARRLQENGTILCLVVTLDAALRRLHLTLGARYHNPHERALSIGHLKREWAVRRLDGIHELDLTYLSDAESIEAVIQRWQALALGAERALVNGNGSGSGNGNGHRNGAVQKLR